MPNAQEKLRLYHAKWQRENPEKHLEYRRKWQRTHRDKVNASNRRRRKANGPRARQSAQRWYSKNRTRVRQAARRWWAKQAVLKSDIWISKNLRTRIYLALRRRQKHGSLHDLLGCSIPELRRYLEQQFKLGMSWDNYGQWQVDHRRPCASFDLSKPENQRTCFHYTNLQPLWKEDNLAKRDSVVT